MFRSIFEIWPALSLRLRYDETSCMLKHDPYKMLRNLLQKGTDLHELRAISKHPLLYMEQYRLSTPYCTEDDFAKDMYDTESNTRLRFFANRHGSKYSLYLQSPFFQLPMEAYAYQTPSAVEKALARLLRERPTAVRTTMSLYTQIEGYQHEISDLFHNTSLSLREKESQGKACMSKMLTALARAKETNLLLADQRNFLHNQITSVYYSEVSAAVQRENKLKQSLNQVITQAQAQNLNADKGQHTPPVPELE